MNTQITVTTDDTDEAQEKALAEFEAALEQELAKRLGSNTTPERWRPKKLDREATRTAVAHRRGPSAFERMHGRKRSGGTPETGACTTFDRGPALTRAIANATRRGRVSKEAA